MKTKFAVLSAERYEGGTRHLIERTDGRKFEVLCTPRSYGGTQGLYEINPLTKWGEGDTNRGKGFVPENKIDSTIENIH